MKRTLLTTTILILLSTNLFGQSITIGEDGIVRCKDVPIGTTGTVFGDVYEVVDRDLLILRRNEGSDLTKVCVSNVTDMSEMFRGRGFNQAIGNWDVSNVTDMSEMFMGSQFNQPIGAWDVGNVKDMREMFRDSPFNQPIGGWNVSNVKNMSVMFINTRFNQPIGDWDVSRVTGMGSMFVSTVFNQPIGDWDVSNVTDMRAMFRYSEFNQPIGDWDVGNVTDMREMFQESQFNQPIEDWDVSSVKNMAWMFAGHWDYTPFNQPIGTWDVTSVTDMAFMLRNSEFNQNISGWCVEHIFSNPNGFASSLTAENLPVWGTCPSPEKLSKFNPGHNSTNVSRTLQFVWEFETNSTKYQLQVIEGFDPVVVDTLVNDTTYVKLTPLKDNVEYNWRVRGVDEKLRPIRYGEWSDVRRFTTGLFETISLFSPENSSSNISVTPTISWNQEPNSGSYGVQVSEDGFNTFIVDEEVAETNLTTPTLAYSTEYSWRVRGISGADQSEWSQPWSFTTQMEPVGTITLVSPENNADKISVTPTLVWNTEPNSLSYRVQASSDGFSTLKVDVAVTDTTFTTPNLAYSTEYSWRVRGTNTSGNGDWSVEWKFTTREQLPDKIVLAAPDMDEVNVSLTPVFVWRKDKLADSYDFQLADSESFSEPILDAKELPDTTLAATDSLAYLSEYYWRVRGVSFHGDGEWSETWSFTTIIEKPDMVDLVSPDSGSVEISINPELKWKASARAEYYRILLAKDVEFEAIVTDSTGFDVPVFSPKALSYNTDYFWKVKAINAGGESPWSQTWSFFTEYSLVAPVLTLPANGSEYIEAPVNLKWEPVETANDYIVELSHHQEFEQLVDHLPVTKAIADNSEASLQNSWGIYLKLETLLPDTVYYWRVKALNESGESNWSEAWHFSTGQKIPDVPVWEPAHESEGVETTPLLVWGASERAEMYDLQLSKNADFSEILIDVSEIFQTEYQVADELNKGATYYWRVRAGNTSGYSDWSEPLSFTTEMPTGVHADQVPVEFMLEQNYPNPFNPSTQIRFAVPEQSHVRLSVYNMLGQHVSTLINDTRSPGWHDVAFDASGLSSGLYMYRLETNGYVETRQMMLVK